MNWRNASYDDPPEDQQKVIISVRGIYYLSFYEAVSNTFRLKESTHEFVDPRIELVYWTDYNHGY